MPIWVGASLSLVACELVLPTVADGPQDGASDGMLSDGPSLDAPPDGTVADAGADVGDGYVCIPIDAAASSVPDASCALSDGSTCTPGSIAGFAPTPAHARPPVAHCTAQQISDFYDGCYGPSATPAMCNDFGSQNSVCYACLVSNATDGRYGPIVMDAIGDYYLNTPGCIELVEPCNTACALFIQANFQCAAASCEPVCPGTSMQASQARSSCEMASETCPCEYYATQSGNCADQIMALNSASTPCLTADTYETAFKFICGVFCGGP